MPQVLRLPPRRLFECALQKKIRLQRQPPHQLHDCSFSSTWISGGGNRAKKSEMTFSRSGSQPPIRNHWSFLYFAQVPLLENDTGPCLGVLQTFEEGGLGHFYFFWSGSVAIFANRYLPNPHWPFRPCSGCPWAVGPPFWAEALFGL